MTGQTSDRSAALFALAVLATAAVAAAPTPPGLSVEGQYVLATMTFAAVLWVSGALPLSVTALTIPVLLTVLGVYPGFEAALSGFADPIIFLFLGTFVLAGALGKHDLDRRIALAVVARVGTTPRRLVLGVMATTAVLSMIVSNTATVAMMTPIALGLVRQVTDPEGDESDLLDAEPADADGGTGAPGGEPPASNLRTAMLLGTAYAASVGGVGTLIGTPPNAIVVSELASALGVQFSFVDWLAVGVPTAALTLPIVWYVLLRLYPPERRDISAARGRARLQYRALGPVDAPGRRVAAVFVAVAALWLLGGLGFLFEGWLPPRLYATLFGGAPNLFGPGRHQGVLYFALVGVLAVPALVLLGAADAGDLRRIDWNTLLLFGGGISLADALVHTGATRWLADAVFGSVAGVPLIVLLFVVIALTVALSELASNTATVAILAPILIEVGPRHAAAYGLTGTSAAVLLAVASAVAASYGFALPVATPPNAIVFGTGEVRRDRMLRAGLLLDVLLAAATTGILLAILAVGFPGVT